VVLPACPRPSPVLSAPGGSSLKDALPAIPVQLIAVRSSEAAADAARRETLSDHNQKRSNCSPLRWSWAGYVCLLTNLDPAELSAADDWGAVPFAGRSRLLQRLKGLARTGVLPARTADLAHTMVYAKLIAALILDDFTGRYLAFSLGLSTGTKRSTFNLRVKRCRLIA